MVRGNPSQRVNLTNNFFTISSNLFSVENLEQVKNFNLLCTIYIQFTMRMLFFQLQYIRNSQVLLKYICKCIPMLKYVCSSQCRWFSWHNVFPVQSAYGFSVTIYFQFTISTQFCYNVFPIYNIAGFSVTMYFQITVKLVCCHSLCPVYNVAGFPVTMYVQFTI